MEQIAKERVFVMCTDGSEKARHAFDVARELLGTDRGGGD